MATIQLTRRSPDGAGNFNRAMTAGFETGGVDKACGFESSMAEAFCLCHNLASNSLPLRRTTMNQPDQVDHAYWSKSLRIVQSILVVWFLLSLGCGILFREMLDAWLPKIGGAPFGFWMAQQGSIVGFIVLLVIYMVLMNRLDGKHGYDEGQL